jgi:predicted Zn-dependent protease
MSERLDAAWAALTTEVGYYLRAGDKNVLPGILRVHRPAIEAEARADALDTIRERIARMNEQGYDAATMSAVLDVLDAQEAERQP